MPAPKKFAKTETYRNLYNQARDQGDTNDCAVKAVAIATGANYNEVRTYMNANGRKNRQGTSVALIKQAVERFGGEVNQKNRMFFFQKILSYPKGHRALKSVTTHHPDRFPGSWKDGRTYLFFTAGHVLCVKDGTNHDWTRGSAKQVKDIWEIT